MSDYTYQPLQDRHVRLLFLQWDPDPDPIRFFLDDGPLDQHFNQYKAMSYTWGNPQDRVDVFATTDDGDKRISVTRNLNGAVRQIRAEKVTWSIWADAICINQKDDDEKSAQVRLMTEIYTRSIEVFVWLGKWDPKHEAGVGLLRETCLAINRMEAEGEDAVQKSLLLRFPMESPAWSSLWSLLCLPWFSRVWIVQEITVARSSTFFLGTVMLTGSDFFLALEFLMTCEEAIGRLRVNRGREPNVWNNHGAAAAISLVEMKMLYREPEREIHFFLMRSVFFQATDQRDKIFALVGLCTDLSPSFIDYRKDVRHVFTEITLLLMLKPSLSTTVLSFAGTNKVVQDLPSWVVQWQGPPESGYEPLAAVFRPKPSSQDINEDVRFSEYRNGGKPGPPSLMHTSIMPIDLVKHIVQQPHGEQKFQEAISRVMSATSSKSGPKLEDLELFDEFMREMNGFNSRYAELISNLERYPTS